MGRAGRRSRLVLLCCAILLLVSTSAVSGFLDENVREWGRLAGRLKRHLAKENVNHQVGRFDVEVDEQKPAEGIWEKALSFFRGAFGNGTPNSAEESVPIERKRERVGRRHSFDRHRGTGPSHRNGIRDLIRNHPERIAAADISSAEPLAVEEDVTPASDFHSKIAGIVSTVLQEYHEEDLEPSLGSTCAGSLELEVISLVKRVKVALREHLSCNGDVASTDEQNFCNRFNGHRTISTLEVLSRTDVNPVDVAWLKMSSTPVCSSVNPHSDFLESLKMMEEIVREFNVLEVLNVEQELKVEHPHFGRHTQQHGVVRRHWWHRMLSKDRHMKHHLVEDASHEREERHRLQHKSKHEGERGPLHHERSDHEKLSSHHEPKEGKLRAHGHKNASHERQEHESKDEGERGPLHHERSGHEKHSSHHGLKEGKLRAYGHKNASHEREGRHWLQHESRDEGERGSLHHERSSHEKLSSHHEDKEEGKLRAHGHKNASHERQEHGSKDEGERGPLHHERSGHEKLSSHHEPKEEGKLRAHGHKNASHKRQEHDTKDEGERGPVYHERSGHEKHSSHHEPKEEGTLRAHGHKNASHEREGGHRLQHESKDEGERGPVHHERSGHQKHWSHHVPKEEGELRAHSHKNASHEREERRRLQQGSKDEGERGPVHHERSGHEKHWPHHEAEEEGGLRAHGHKNASHEREDRHRWQHGSKEEGERSPLHHERSGHKRHRSHQKHKEEGELRAHGHQDNEHEKHWWQRMSGMFLDLNHRRHQGFERAHGQDCDSRIAKHFARGMKEHVVTTCKSSTDENVITACKFAEQHHFLVKTWLAVKIPLWTTTAMVCEHPINSSSGSFQHRVPHASNLSDGPQLDTSKRSARKHFDREFNKTQHLRGLVIRIPTGDSADSSSTKMLADLQKLQDRLDELVRNRRVSITHLSKPGQETKVMVVTPLGHDVFKRGRPHFRISAKPDQAMPLSEGRRHFRISARPRARKDSHKETSTNVLPFEGVSDETGSAGMDDMDVEIQGKAAIHTAENRASM